MDNRHIAVYTLTLKLISKLIMAPIDKPYECAQQSNCEDKAHKNMLELFHTFKSL